MGSLQWVYSYNKGLAWVPCSVTLAMIETWYGFLAPSLQLTAHRTRTSIGPLHCGFRHVKGLKGFLITVSSDTIRT